MHPGRKLCLVTLLLILSGCASETERATRPEIPDWIRQAVIYEVYPRSFSGTADFKGIESRLPELKELGVTVLWLMPIQPIGLEKRKGSLGSPYSIRDYRAVNPEFGTFADFKSLVDETHRLGMRIIIDWVANHTAWDHSWSLEHPEWYTRDSSGERVSPVPDWSDVADLNYDQAALRREMTDALRFWVVEGDVDGFRCDVAEMVPTDFWQQAIAELRQVKPLLMLAEGDDRELHDAGFDLTYSWEPYHALVRYFRREGTLSDVRAALDKEPEDLAPGRLRLRFTANHDENAWNDSAVAIFGTDGARAAAALFSLLPGAPLLYNGQEVGNRKRLPLFEKEAISWQEGDPDFREFYSSLYRLRRQHSELVTAPVRFLEPEPNAILFRRGDLLAAVNLAAEPFVRSLEQAGIERLGGDGTTSGRLLQLPPYGFFLGRMPR